MSRRIFLLSWVAAFILGAFVVSPGTDDIAYIGPALGLTHTGNLGFFLDGQASRIFSNFPGYPFAQGIFYFLYDSLGLPLNFNTYRLFNLGLFLGLLFLSLRFVENLYPNDPQYGTIHACFVLVAMAISLRAMTLWDGRPETIGSVLTMTSLVAHQSYFRNGQKNIILYVVAAIALGFSAICHPVFVVTASAIGLGFVVIELKQRRVLRSLLYFAAAMIPVVIMIGWYAAYYPLSTQSLLSQSEQLARPGIGQAAKWLINVLRLEFGHQWSVNVLYFVMALPIPIMVGVGTIGMVHKAARPSRREPYDIVVGSVFLSTYLILSIPLEMHYIVALAGFMALLVFPYYLPRHQVTAAIDRWFSSTGRAVVLVLGAAAILFWPSLNMAKQIAWPGKFLNPGMLISEVASYSGAARVLVVMHPELASVVIKYYSDAYSSESRMRVELAFPIGLDQKGSPRFKADARLRLQSVLDDLAPNQTIWLTRRSILNDSYSENAFCMHMAYQDMEIRFLDSETLYQDDKYKLFVPGRIERDCRSK